MLLRPCQIQQQHPILPARVPALFCLPWSPQCSPEAWILQYKLSFQAFGVLSQCPTCQVALAETCHIWIASLHLSKIHCSRVGCSRVNAMLGEI